jgi:hypothetical protein
MIGPCLGPYEITAPIGAGAMGKIHGARDGGHRSIPRTGQTPFAVDAKGITPSVAIPGRYVCPPPGFTFVFQAA